MPPDGFSYKRFKNCCPAGWTCSQCTGTTSNVSDAGWFDEGCAAAFDVSAIKRPRKKHPYQFPPLPITRPEWDWPRLCYDERPVQPAIQRLKPALYERPPPGRPFLFLVQELPVDDAEYERRDVELKAALTPQLTDDFLVTLERAIRTYGWEGDYSELLDFRDWCYRVAEKPEPAVVEPFLNWED